MKFFLRGKVSSCVTFFRYFHIIIFWSSFSLFVYSSLIHYILTSVFPPSTPLSHPTPTILALTLPLHILQAGQIVDPFTCLVTEDGQFWLLNYHYQNPSLESFLQIPGTLTSTRFLSLPKCPSPKFQSSLTVLSPSILPRPDPSCSHSHMFPVHPRNLFYFSFPAKLMHCLLKLPLSGSLSESVGCSMIILSLHPISTANDILIMFFLIQITFLDHCFLVTLMYKSALTLK